MAEGDGWKSYGAHAARQRVPLAQRLTNNPKIDAFIRAGYEAAEAERSAKPPRVVPPTPPGDLFGMTTPERGGTKVSRGGRTR